MKLSPGPRQRKRSSLRRFTVVIPTMQRSPYLGHMVDMYCSHSLVGEVLVINNVLDTFGPSHPKLRVMQQSSNIYVNPAWNLGASKAHEEYLIIANDDIWFQPSLIDTVSRFLMAGPHIGIIGPSFSSINRHRDGRAVFLPAYRLPHGFGTLMFMRTDNYIPIPDDLLILRGDDWLFQQQRHRNWQIFGARIGTHWSMTAANAEFDEIKERDRQIFSRRHESTTYNDRYRVEERFLKWGRSLYRSVSRSQ